MPGLPRLYAILDVDTVAARGLDPLRVADAWLDAGVRLLQLRAKTLESGPWLAVADALASRCREAGAVFIVNDRVDVARLSGAAGVHLGQTDLRPAEARLLLPAPALVGLSTHGPAQARTALETPIDYVAIGPVFDTATKTRPDPTVGLDGVRDVRAMAAPQGLPVVAIGGITLARAADVLASGADAVAVVGDLLLGDPGARARAFIREVGGPAG